MLPHVNEHVGRVEAAGVGECVDGDDRLDQARPPTQVVRRLPGRGDQDAAARPHIVGSERSAVHA